MKRGKLNFDGYKAWYEATLPSFVFLLDREEVPEYLELGEETFNPYYGCSLTTILNMTHRLMFIPTQFIKEV